ncbi:MAG: fibronectin type III domain-containing protein [Steroidobacterales bacterium]
MPLIRFTARLTLTALAAGLFCASLARADGAPRVFAAQVPGGAVRVLVVMTDGRWPAGGMRIEDGAGTVLVAHVERDAQALGALDAGSRNAIVALQRLAAGADPQAAQTSAILVLRLVSDWTLARAVGAGVELPADSHPHSIRVVLLKAGGESGAVLGPLTVQSDAGPPAPTALLAEAGPAGISLRWQTAARPAAVPVYAFSVTRRDGGAQDSLTPHPELLTMLKPGAPNPYLDRAPPVETTLSYAVRLVDVLGVPGEAAAAQIYSPDFAAGAPPAGQSANAGRGFVTLSWTSPTNPRTSGLVVERSQLADGPYERLTPDGLSPRSARFEDHQVIPGASYYYRVRAVTPNGDLGPAGDPVRAEALAASPLSAPTGLVADAGLSHISIRWTPVPGQSLAGYILERRATGMTSRWARLNSRLLAEPRYLDAVGPSVGGSFDYRVTAVATDEGLSPPSELLHVALVDSAAPAAPNVISVSGADGHVQIRFVTAEPAAKTAQVALLRAESPSESGLVVGAPVAGSAGAIGDDWVRGGQAYWYRLVAFDKNGNRSAETDAFEVRVGAVNLPTPKAPSVRYAAEPAPQVTLGFDPPPPHVRVIIEVQSDDGHWKKVVGPTDGASAVDLNPPGAHASYRIVYVADSGGAGVASPAAAAR